MNEHSTLKLHKSHKILCFIICFVIVLSLTCVSSFAVNSQFTVRSVPLNSVQYSFFEEGGVLSFPCSLPFTSGDETYTFTTLNVSMDYIIGEQQSYVFSFPVSVNGETVDIIWFGYIENADGSFQIADLQSGLPRTLNGYIDIPDNMKPFFYNVLDFIDDYEGNMWADILQGVIEALDVNIFGTFSYLDIVSTLAGACLAIWLLKMLAGG